MTVTLSPPYRITAEEFADNEQWGKFTELIDGELVSLSPARYNHNHIALRFIFLFAAFSKRTGVQLRYGGDNDGFLLSRNPDTVLSPDASLFHYRPGVLDNTWLEFAPELVVEILSPSNSRSAITLKKGKYFAAGAEQVWIADVENATLEIHFRDGRRLTATDGVEVQCEGIAEGLTVKLAEIFAPI